MDMQVLTVFSKGQSVDAIMLKTLKMPTIQELEKSLDEAKKWAASVGYEEKDVNDIIKSVRKRNRK